MSILNRKQHLRVSVALCTYNGARYITEQLRSILEQEYPVWQIVICDDGSTDDTLAIVREVTSGIRRRIEIYRNREQLGIRRNFAQAISRCRGDLIALADQDDLWFAEKTLQLTAMFLGDPALGGVFSDAVIMDDRSRRNGKTLWESYEFNVWEQIRGYEGLWASTLLRRPVATGATMMFRASLVPHLLPIPDPWMHDAWITWQILLHSKLVPVNRRLMAYRVHGGQQIGIPPTLASRWRKLAARNMRFDLGGSRERVLEEYRHQVVECEQLAASVTGARTQPGKHISDLRAELRRKRDFYARACRALSRSRISRATFGMAHLHDYRKFSYLGLRAMLRDIAL